MNSNWDALWTNATLATMTQDKPFGLLQNAAIAVKNNKIAWLGSMQDLPEHQTKTIHDAAGRCITPGLVDCHTHLVYAGSRAHEFEMRLLGKTYEEIARAGGGIISTVNATRAASEEDLLQQSLQRAKRLLAHGVTTIEIKSGYGLDLATELKILRVAKRIEELLPVTVFLTFLGAHTLPPEYRDRADAYIDLVCNEMIPAIAEKNLAHAVDVFCEKIAFSPAQTERVFQTAQQYHLKIKCHAEQLSDTSSAMLAAKYQAVSADHLEFASEKSIEAMAASGTVAVLLPGAFYFLREKQLPPIELLRRYHVPIALATDCNPGTSPVTSLPLMMNMGCTLFRLTPEEVWRGVTIHAARALGMETICGTLEPGKQADFIMWDASNPVEITYQIGGCPILQKIKNGKLINAA